MNSSESLDAWSDRSVVRPGRVLVTGADGLIGRAVVAELVEAGVGVTALSPKWDRPSPADRIVTGDATEVADVSDGLADVDAVVHLGAIAHRDLAPPYEVYRTNTSATFNVLSQAGQRGISRAVIASSINAFGVPMNHHDVQPAYFPIDEEIPTQIDDWYSLSKRSDELTAAMAASHWGIDVLAVRLPHVAPLDNLCDYAARAALAPARLVREGWSYLDLRDAVRVLLLGLVVPFDGAHVIAVAARDTLLATDTTTLLDRYAPDVPRRRAFTGRDSLIDTTRAANLLGFSPRHSIHASEGSGPAPAPVGAPQ
ncbi:NAD(P)-dependent oxidoreductase [Occultella aeris]|uniref:UDP-glucose 4-epimerase n=1 Tax=Occultella aeris TaxID=2761496 RepID=A0A7M4DRU9_9MICO|nr:NAD(P)-dependent oxidoreductase [Occultella aeris]VZO40193.1 UDP-glucose 4-epimerase [Occultella aeris]